MKICFFADSESIHTERWCKHFQSLGHEIHLITFKQKHIEGIQTYCVNANKINVSGGNWKVLLHFRKVKKLLKLIQPDIFHALYATSYGITGALCNFHPYVITALGSDILISPKSSSVYRKLLKFAFNRADKITVMADHMLQPTRDLGATEKQLEVVPFGINEAVFYQTGEPLSNDRFIVTSTRNFETIYNIPHLLKAVEKVVGIIPTIHVNLIGAGSLKDDLIGLTKELGIEKQVSFVGKLPQPEIAAYLNQSHVFVSLSLSDGNNISLNESMACGTWNIATDIPANHQWIRHGENGFLVAIDDVESLAELLITSHKQHAELIEQAKSLNQQLLQEKGIWRINMQKVETMYHQLIHK